MQLNSRDFGPPWHRPLPVPQNVVAWLLAHDLRPGIDTFTPAEQAILLTICQRCQWWSPATSHCLLCASGPTSLWLRKSKCKVNLWPAWASLPPTSPSPSV